MPKIDLEAFAKDHNKEKEGIKFEQDMAQLTKELENLDEGKYCHPKIGLQPCKSAKSVYRGQRKFCRVVIRNIKAEKQSYESYLCKREPFNNNNKTLRWKLPFLSCSSNKLPLTAWMTVWEEATKMIPFPQGLLALNSN